MAQIRNLKLEVAEGSLKSKAMISIEMDVDFSGVERQLSMQFGLFIGIYEGDFSKDMILPMSNGLSDGRIYNLDPSRTGTKNTQDDAIEVFFAGNLLPRRRRSLRIKLEREVRLKNRNVNKESFRVAAYVVPEISSAFAVSNEVRIQSEEQASTANMEEIAQKKPVAATPAIKKKPVASSAATKKRVAVKKTATETKKTAAKPKLAVKKPTATAKPRTAPKTPSTTEIKEEAPVKATTTKSKTATTTTTKSTAAPKRKPTDTNNEETTK